MIYVCLALCAVIVAMDIFHRMERKDLYNRIQSKDYKEYMTMNNASPSAPKSRHDEVLKRWRDKQKRSDRG